VDRRPGDHHATDGAEAGPAPEALVATPPKEEAASTDGVAETRERAPAAVRSAPAAPRRVKRKKKRKGGR
jgi:hypothetical protein